MAATKQDLDEVVFEIGTCEAQIVALKDALGDRRGRGFDLSTVRRALVVKEIKLALLLMRREEIADDLFADRGNERRPAGRRSH